VRCAPGWYNTSMIATLTGTVAEKLGDSLVIDIGGVGYEVVVTADDWGGTALNVAARFYIYEQIREDAHNLYGFSTLSARSLFAQLIGVSGVGPKLAMQILSAAGEARLRQAIASGDPSLLKGITGVGPKTAQRVIVDLRGKVEEGTGPGLMALAPVADPAYQALVSLGYTPGQASAAVASIPADLTDDQARVKAALKGASK
jgi:holliday junction DNA helicase RuvA